MKTSEFLKQLHDADIVAEIARAESVTSGEIRVFVSQQEVGDVVERARARFVQLKMARTKERNAVLLYFAPRSQKFAVIGDEGIHGKCGTAFWEEVVLEIRPHFQSGQFTEGVRSAVRKIGEVLARHFPISPGDRNELPDEILGD